MKVTFLGTGTSQGVPIIGCDCEVCTSDNTKDKRLRTSIMVESETTRVVIDSGPDFRQQMLREKVKTLDALLFTHAHKDHLAGMDDIRAFNYFQQQAMDVFATEETQQIIRKDFDYIFNNASYPGVPQINLKTIQAQPIINIGDIQFQPVEVMHYKMKVLGFRIHDFTYITDANYISPQELEKVKGSKILVLNALRRESHISHFTLAEAIQLAEVVGAEQTYFTHMSHQMGKHDDVNLELPDRIALAYDGLSISI